MTTLSQLNGERTVAGLRDRVVWVTGASRGLGQAIARGLAEAGARIALMARSQAALDSLAVELRAGQANPLVLPGSVTDPAAVRAAADSIISTLGPVEVLINAAGINPVVVRTEQLEDALWQEILDVNLTGTLYCCREAGRQMLEAGHGSIINISSVHGSAGVPRMAAYAASKGGVEALTRALAIEWADRRVRVNCLAPGYFLTPLTRQYLASANGSRVRAAIPLGRIGEPSELVGAALYLASDASSYVTGTTLRVDGGWSAQ